MARAPLADAIQRPAGPRSQRGYAGLALALIGLIAASVLALPIMGRASSALHGQARVATFRSNGASSAAEHALWRIRNDPAFLDSMTGTPPSASYTLDLPGGPADISVTASSDPPQSSGITVYLSVSPTSVPPDTPTTVTYTLTVVNDDNVPHEISRVDAWPILFSPQYTAGSSTGITTEDPVWTWLWWRWDVFPTATVGPFGDQAILTWDMVVNEPVDSYVNLVETSVQVDGVGTLWAPLSAFVTGGDVGDIDVQVSVTPAEVTAGIDTTFQYTVTVTNNGASPVDAERIEFSVTRDLDYVTGSTSGVTVADPSIYWDFLNDRWWHRWDFAPVTLVPGQPVTLSFQERGSLLPGVVTAVASVRIPDTGGGVGATITTGETAPILVVRAFDIVASQGGRTVTVQALMHSNGVDILSWTES